MIYNFFREAAGIPDSLMGPVLDLAKEPKKIDLKIGKLQPGGPEQESFSILDIKIKRDTYNDTWSRTYMHPSGAQLDQSNENCRTEFRSAVLNAINNLSGRARLVDTQELKKGYHVLSAQIRAIVGIACLAFAYVVKTVPSISAALALTAEKLQAAQIAFAALGALFLALAASQYRKSCSVPLPENLNDRRILLKSDEHTLASIFASALAEFKDRYDKGGHNADQFLFYLKENYKLTILNPSKETNEALNQFVVNTKFDGTKFEK